MTTDPENPLLIDILSASNTAYTYKPDDKIVDVIFKLFLLMFGNIYTSLYFITLIFYYSIPILSVKIHY
jgi:hypothetical protein